MVGVRVGMVRGRRLLKYWCWVDVPRARRLRLLLLVTEPLPSYGRRVLLTIIMIMTRRQATILVMMIIVLIQLILILIHRLDVIVLPYRGRRLTRHPLKTPTLPRGAIGFDVRPVALVSTVLVIA